MPKFFKMHYAKTHLSELVERALGGEEVVIARDDRPLVRLVPATPPEHPQPGAMSEVLAPMSLEDFAPLTEEELKAMGFAALLPSQA
jgi:antitoxin (DNA-binding transcriptional repressor) of toxin-antitoxin stability system